MTAKCDSGVVGNARPCQGRDRGFEPRLSLYYPDLLSGFFIIEAWLSLVERCVRDAEAASSNLVASTQNLSGFEKFSYPLFYLSSNFFLTFIIYQYFYGGWILRPEKPDDQNAEVRLSLTLPPTSGCIYLKTASLCVTVQYSTIVHVRTEMKLRFFKNHTRRTRK